MIDQFRSIFGGLNIKEHGDEIIITGVDARVIVRDINKHWKTTRITLNFFNTVGYRRLTFYKFFAPEFLYLLDGITQYRNRYTSAKMINQLKSAMLESTWLKDTVKDTLPGRLDFSRLKNLVFTPEDYQLKYFKDYDTRLNRYGLKGDLVDAATGTGKALRSNVPVRTPDGWREIGLLEPGDFVISPQGTPTEVLGVYPQGVKDVYRITFEDGRSTECCLDHLWEVYVNGRSSVIDTATILELLETNVVLEIRLIKSQEGGNDSPETVMFNGTTQGRLGVLNEYYTQYGFVVEGSQKPYMRVSDPTLVSHLQRLIRSLGGTTRAYNDYHDGKATSRLTIMLPIGLDLEHDTLEPKDYHLKTNRIRISSVKATTPFHCVCIMVDSPDRLFVVEDYIVTHNTYITTAIAEMLASDLIVVVCPREALEMVWIPSLDEMYKTKQTVWASNKIVPYNGERFILCHYQALDKLLVMLEDSKIYRNKKVTTILDESHYLNTIDSQRTQWYLDLVKLLDSDNNMLASGTAVKALGSELIPLLRVVDPMFTSKVEARFKKAYGATASKGLDIIRFRLGLVSFKIEKGVLELSPPIMNPYPIKIPNGNDFTLPSIKIVMREFIAERVKYYQARLPEDLIFWEKVLNIHKSKLKTASEHDEFKRYLLLIKMIRHTKDIMAVKDQIKMSNDYEKRVIEPNLPRDMIHDFRDIKSAVKYPQLKIQGECLGRVLGGKRIECHVAMVPYIDWVGIVESTTKKTIMFTSFVEALEEAQEFTSKLGLKPLSVYGKNKNEIVNTLSKFDKEPNLNPMLATYMSLSTGVRMTMADTIILLNTPFRQYILEQAVARAYRKGQDSQVVVYKVTLDTGEIPNISTRSDDILKWSAEQVASILGLTTTFTEGDVVASFETVTMDTPLVNVPDDNKMFFDTLDNMFAFADIKVSEEAYTEEPVRNKTVPHYLR